MTRRLPRLLRLLLALALVGVGPGTRVADVLLFHAGAATVGVASQVDDGSTPLPHGDGCTLATLSTPAAPAVTCGAELAVAPATAAPHAPAAVAVPATRAGRSPPSRAPPTLLS